MPFRYDVQIDFIRDFNMNLKRQLEGLGFKDNVSCKDACFQLLNLKRRLVSQKPRKVLLSKEFTCPEYLKEGLNLLKEKIEKGENIQHHLSKGILDLNYHDDLLNDWGIHHLHLGTQFGQDKRFIKRTGPVLFARFDNDYAYFINVMKHGNWANQGLVKIIHRNWPDSIKQFRMDGVTGISPKPNNEEYKLLRKAHVTTFVEVEQGVVYFPIGMGYMSSGHSTDVIRTCDFYMNRLRVYEEHVKKNIAYLAKEIRAKGIDLGNSLVFLLGIEDNDVYAFETKYRIFIKLGPLF